MNWSKVRALDGGSGRTEDGSGVGEGVGRSAAIAQRATDNTIVVIQNYFSRIYARP